MKRFKTLLFMLLAAPVAALAAGGHSVPLDKAPVNLSDNESLQRGARMFVNYCLNCHSAGYMRYSRLQDIGLTEDQIKENLMFATEKPGETMDIAMNKRDAKTWFGATPPDLTVISRSRGADWLYTYLRTFYRDDSRPTGWNNLVFDKVGMPHVMWDLQGELAPRYKKEGEHEVIEGLELVRPGSVTLAQYDAMVGDLVNYLVWMGEPAQQQRKQLGLIVLAFLAVFFVVAYYLKKEFWKDIH
ncbi:MAG: cytochrome c1 [Thiobacillaceae bacterium]|jgi:ubiquinol-cytochrome c reductase cytochrome c1 subunit|nr:cytochrome c1 [Thiobacillaceae bacterium]